MLYKYTDNHNINRTKVDLFVRPKFQKRSALKFVSRTIPQKAEGLILRSSAAEEVSKACFGVSYP